VSLAELFEKVDALPGDNLSRFSDLFIDFVLFSIFARSFGLGEASAPIALQVCANNANGLFFESNCK
jgi:hypothetical protein